MPSLGKEPHLRMLTYQISTDIKRTHCLSDCRIANTKGTLSDVHKVARFMELSAESGASQICTVSPAGQLRMPY